MPKLVGLIMKDSHAQTCRVNHEGSSGAMEKEGAIEMFTRSTETHRMRYTVYGLRGGWSLARLGR